MQSGAFRTYKSVRVQTATPENLLLMLFDALARHTRHAVEALEAQDGEQANRRLLKGQEILDELTAALDMRHDVAHNLHRLYEFCNELLQAANLRKDAAPARDALGLIQTLRDTWHEAAKGLGPVTPPANGLSAAARSVGGIDIDG